MFFCTLLRNYASFSELLFLYCKLRAMLVNGLYKQHTMFCMHVITSRRRR